MKYYKVKEYKDFSDGTVLIENELLTEREFQKTGYPENWFEIVNVLAKKTYWFFGARFTTE